MRKSTAGTSPALTRGGFKTLTSYLLLTYTFLLVYDAITSH